MRTSQGIWRWKKGAAIRSSIAAAAEGSDGVHFCSDAFSTQPGWMEGALEAAHAVLASVPQPATHGAGARWNAGREVCWGTLVKPDQCVLALWLGASARSVLCAPAFEHLGFKAENL